MACRRSGANDQRGPGRPDHVQRSGDQDQVVGAGRVQRHFQGLGDRVGLDGFARRVGAAAATTWRRAGPAATAAGRPRPGGPGRRPGPAAWLRDPCPAACPTTRITERAAELLGHGGRSTLGALQVLGAVQHDERVVARRSRAGRENAPSRPPPGPAGRRGARRRRPRPRPGRPRSCRPGSGRAGPARPPRRWPPGVRRSRTRPPTASSLRLQP